MDLQGSKLYSSPLRKKAPQYRLHGAEAQLKTCELDELKESSKGKRMLLWKGSRVMNLGGKIIDEEMKRFVTENVVREDAAVTRRSDWKTDPNRGQTEGEEGGGGWKQNCWPASK